jgi:hypothetical protein
LVTLFGADPSGRRLLTTAAGQAYVDAFSTEYCTGLGLTYQVNCHSTYTVDYAVNKVNIKFFVDQSVADTVTEETKNTVAAAANTAANAASTVDSTGVESSTSSTSASPTASPTPEPTLSWQSRFLFWMWLVNWFRSMW